MVDLDFGLLPVLGGHRVFMGLPHWLQEPLADLRLPATLDRIRGACLLIDQVSPSKDGWENAAYLRAGLNDFQKMGAALRWDLGQQGRLYRPTDSLNPLIHLVFHLRRPTVYVADAPTMEKSTTATFYLADKEHSADIQVVTIPDVEGYLRKNGTVQSHYDADAVSRICGWFEDRQATYGAPQLLTAGVIQYGMELYGVYRGRAAGPPPDWFDRGD